MAQPSQSTTGESVGVSQSGNNNHATIHYHAPAHPDDETIKIMRKIIKHQQRLIEIYQKRQI